MDIRICFIGDSFVNGTGDRGHLGWTGRVCASASQRGIDITGYNLGVRRDTTTDIKHRWKHEFTNRHFQEADNRIVFSFGVNDSTVEQGILRVQPDISASNINEILTEAVTLCPVIMIGPQPIDDADQNKRTLLLDNEFQSVCKRLSAPYLSVFNALSSSPVWMQEAASNDGAHPGDGGYQFLSQLVLDWEDWWF